MVPENKGTLLIGGLQHRLGVLGAGVSEIADDAVGFRVWVGAPYGAPVYFHRVGTVEHIALFGGKGDRLLACFEFRRWQVIFSGCEFH